MSAVSRFSASTPVPTAVTRVVAGCDGDEGSVAVLAAAAYEARQRAVPLQILVAYEAPMPMDPDMPPSDISEQELATGSRRVVEDAWAHVRDSAGLSDLDVRIEVQRGNPAHVLVETGAEDALIVLGRRHKNLMERLLLGSTCGYVAKHAHCAVLFVPVRGTASAD